MFQSRYKKGEMNILGKLKKGYVQIYTGNGKGKTTAAVGLAVRAAGNGYNVFMVQFLKGSKTGEIESAKKMAPFFNIYLDSKKREDSFGH